LGTISFESYRQHFPFTSWQYEALTGRILRRAFLSLFLISIFAVMATHIRSYLLVRKFQQVLSGLSRIQIDKTTEAELAQAIPYLVRGATEMRRNAHAETHYYVVLSNESDWLLHQMNFGHFGYWFPRSRVLKVAGWLGYRYINYHAQLLVIDGKVSRIWYGIADENKFPAGFDEIISVRSAHGFWDQDGSTVVTPTDDESPQFRVSGDERSLQVTYMFDAPPEQASRAFDINLSCFWKFRGCGAAREIAPLLWQYKNEMQEKAASRLVSGQPCPVRILTGRVRYLPDLDVFLLDVVRVPNQPPGDGRERSGKSLIGYGLRQIIRGSHGASEEAKKIRYNPEIRASSNPSSRFANPLSRDPQLGDQVLLFTGELFRSCQIIPNTPPALSVVQKGVAVPRLQEDEILDKFRL
jgi:hypothetical protein